MMLADRRRSLWLAAAVIMVLGPIVFNLSRSDGHRASVQVFPVNVPPFPATFSPDYYRALVRNEGFRAMVSLALDRRPVDWDAVRVEKGEPRRTVILSAVDSTVERARGLIGVLGPQLAAATSRDLGQQAREVVPQLRERLRSGTLPATRRELFRTDLRAAERVARRPPARVVLAEPSVEGAKTWADKVADALPGSLPGRANPVWAGLAGLLLVGTVWAISLRLVPPRRG